jgi:hypothetical protein
MNKKCPKCHAEREVRSFHLMTERCPSCGHNAFKELITRLWRATFRFIQRANPWAIGGLCLIAVAIPLWVLLDACFDPAMNWALVDLGFPEATDSAAYWMPGVSEKYHQWSALGTRITALLFIAWALPVCVVISLGRIILIPRRKWHVTVFCFAAAVLIATFLMYDHLLWIGARRRVGGELPRFQVVAERLLEDWPSQRGQIPEIGEYFVHGERPGQLFFYNLDSFSLTESFGAFIDHLPDGGVMFSLEPHYRFLLEYHPNGGRPARMRETKYTIDTLIRSDRLAEGWYLTEYSYAGK